jgi:ferredoxin/flavodoxin
MQSRVLIFYHSASGNTSWIALKLAEILKEYEVAVVTCNIAHRPTLIDFSCYDLVGFGCPVMGFRPSFAMTSFIDSLPPQNDVPAFIFTTYTGILANTPWMLANRLRRQGFVVVTHKNFFSEVSWPILRAVGIMSNYGKPNEESLAYVRKYVQELSLVMKELTANRALQSSEIAYSKFNPFYYLGLINTPGKLRIMMGKKKIVEEKCTQCGYCKIYCAVGAITLNPYPTFDEKCTGCWGCFNICPEGAIKTIVGSKGRYKAKVAYLNDQQAVYSK